MNKIILMGRLTRDPEVRYGGAQNTAIARFSIAVDRRFKREGQPDADFFNCVAFGKTAEVIEKYMHKGTKVLVDGEMRNNNYESKKHPGEMVYSFEVNVNQIEFAESKGASQAYQSQQGASQQTEKPEDVGEGFMNIPDGVDENLPFV
ncbi:single-stranded DNA-binding protein [Candidatus Weimeria sp. HCP3S3_B5]|jgi:single-strand DNA-binding protein|uniref:single-stranded DNA-binding protein n=1 Tax=Candidatus Weimeria sp. HCP3S3_B5 TaxID=3438871 RepID=UPI002A9F26F4|nr:single-stranded DNA-binding protein [Lachnospiraceae bacterium]MDY6353127.1 single-stranded DNA-binding protein [Lachnospiraceae bacterium]